MRKLTKPYFNINAIVNECSKSFDDSIKKANYQKCADYIESKSAMYDET